MSDVDAVVLGLLEDVVGLLDLDELHRGLLAALDRVVPSRWASLNDIGPGPGDVTVIVVPEIDPEGLATFTRLRHENPLIVRYEQTFDGRAYRFSDVISREDYHRLALYREFYGPLGVEHQIAFTLPAAPDRILGVVLSRSDRDYSDHERDVLDRARPGLIQVFRNAVAFDRTGPLAGARVASVAQRLRVAGLSSRQAAVVARLAAGSAPDAIAAELGIARRTVDKHLQLAYRALDVADGPAAIERTRRLITPG